MNIDQKAEKAYPVIMVSPPNSNSDYFPYDVNERDRKIWVSGYIAGATEAQDGWTRVVTVNEIVDIAQNGCQLLNGIKPDAEQEKWWSEWDESVLQSMIELLKKLQPHYKK